MGLILKKVHQDKKGVRLAMKVDQARGREVIESKGWKIGRIRDFIFDQEGWKITAIEVELTREIAEEFKLRKRLGKTCIPVGVDHIRAISGDHVVLGSSKGDLFNIFAPSQGQKIEN